MDARPGSWWVLLQRCVNDVMCSGFFQGSVVVTRAGASLSIESQAVPRSSEGLWVGNIGLGFVGAEPRRE